MATGRPREKTSNHTTPPTFRLHLMERWVTRRLGSIEHERRVTRIATTLFELTSPHHELTSVDLRLLQLAAVVHDVGRSVDDDEHPAIGARMIADDAWLPLTNFERRALSYMTLYHRGSVPELGKDDVLHDSDERETVRLLLGFLRAADALDSRSLESPRLVFAMRGKRLQVTCYLDEVSPKARRVYARRKKFRLLEELLNCRVEVIVETAQMLEMVA